MGLLDTRAVPKLLRFERLVVGLAGCWRDGSDTIERSGLNDRRFRAGSFLVESSGEGSVEVGGVIGASVLVELLAILNVDAKLAVVSSDGGLEGTIVESKLYRLLPGLRGRIKSGSAAKGSGSEHRSNGIDS